MLSEADIIHRFQDAFSSSADVIGIGDDAAVVPFNDTQSYVISKDILVEHKHFRLSTTDAASLAHKALHVNLSDIGAMGAVPKFVVLGLALPPTLSPAWITDFSASFAAACKQRHVLLIGGDTTASERDVFLSVTVMGEADNKHLKFRNGAKPGDVICVAGCLGEAHAGLVALEKKIPGLDDVKRASIMPTALFAEGVWLGQQLSVTAMMDVSDGLYVDLQKLCKSSGVGAEIDLGLLSASTHLADACAILNLTTRDCLLAGGEDYALLFTVSASGHEALARHYGGMSFAPLMKIGVVTAGKDVVLREGGKAVAFTSRAFSHFGEL